MILPRHIFKRMYKEFLAWKRAGETKEKIDHLKMDPRAGISSEFFIAGGGIAKVTTNQ